MENTEKQNIQENKENLNKGQNNIINNSINTQNQNQYPLNQQQQKNIPFTKPNERVKTKVNINIYNSQFLIFLHI